MQKITVTFDRVFDIAQLSNTNYSRIWTNFSFEFNQKRYFDVIVSGWPELKEGTTLTILLERPDDWHSVFGWVEHDTGKIVGPEMRKTNFALGFILTVFAAFMVFINIPLGAKGLSIALTFTVFSAAAALGLYARWQYRRIKLLQSIKDDLRAGS